MYFDFKNLYLYLADHYSTEPSNSMLYFCRLQKPITLSNCINKLDTHATIKPVATQITFSRNIYYTTVHPNQSHYLRVEYEQTQTLVFRI